jgi:hypothetical protein
VRRGIGVRRRLLEVNRDRAERDARIERAGTAGALAAERRSAAQAAVDASTSDVAAASSSRIEPDYGSGEIQHQGG